jgi:hypothetical protein
VKAVDSSAFIGLNDSKGNCLVERDRNRRDGHVGVHAFVKRDHVLNIHSVDMICTENCHETIFWKIQESQILIDCVCCSSIPSVLFGSHLRRNRDDELFMEETAWRRRS